MEEQLLAAHLSTLATFHPTTINDLRQALLNGKWKSTSTSAELRAIGGAKPALVDVLQSITRAWNVKSSDLSPSALALALQVASSATTKVSSRSAHLEVVSSGTRALLPGVRSTSEVIRDMIRKCGSEMFVIGYALTSSDLLRSLSVAVNRGVRLSLLIHDDTRNRNAIKTQWPLDIPLPRIFVWKRKTGNKMAKMHMKVVISDSSSALITSANITHLAMNENLELGIFVSGGFVREIGRYFGALISKGLIQEIEL